MTALQSASNPTVPDLIAAESTGCLDVHRVFGISRFFSVFSFDSGEELLRTIAGIELDLGAVVNSADLQRSVLSGSLYWLLYLKGYVQYSERGEVEDSNIYFNLMTRYFDANAHDPGIAGDLSDPARARARIRRRFDDVDLFRYRVASDPTRLHLVDPVVVTIRTPPSERATVVFELDSDSPRIGEIDGYHRLFASRVFGVRWLPCRFIQHAADQTGFDIAIRQLVHFALPYDAHVAVLPDVDNCVLELPQRLRTLLMLPAALEEVSTTDLVNHLLGEIESARVKGAEFLLLPARGELSMGSLLGASCDDRYRLVANESGVGAVYFLNGREAPRVDEGSPPLPPPEIGHLAIGIRDPAKLSASGLVGIQSMEAILATRGLRLNSFGSILDFGCGCGRVLCHLRHLSSQLYGADYNPYLVSWCEHNLPFARFVRTNSVPGLPFENESFDFVFSIATFSHLDETLQRPWIRELVRILRPGAPLFLTIHGVGRAAELPPELQERFTAGEVVVTRPGLSGTNASAAYHPEGYVRSAFGAELELLEYVPGGARDVRQDAVLFRKASAGESE